MKVFRSARIKLTALYLTVIMLISVSFSLAVYGILSREVERFARSQRFRMENRMEMPLINRPPLPFPDSDLVNEAKTRLAVTLGIINIGIFVSAGFLGYFLAGRTLNPIAKMMEEQNQFISDASHELKTPLTALKSSFEVFLREPKPDIPTAKELIKDGIKDVDNLSELAGSLLELSKFSESDGGGKFSPVGIGEVIRESISKLNPLAQKNNITIDFMDPNVKILGGKEKLTELFVILLDNAVKYGHEGGRVNISAHREDGHVVVEVADNGVGISNEDLPHIFDRFYRADASRSQTNVSGHGLGLAIAKSIVEAHKGSITARSRLGEGTTIQLKFRVAEVS